MQDEEQQIQAVVEPETYPLDGAAIDMLADMDAQEASLNTARQAILSYFAKQHQLQGQWRLAPNRKELVKAQ